MRKGDRGGDARGSLRRPKGACVPSKVTSGEAVGEGGEGFVGKRG